MNDRYLSHLASVVAPLAAAAAVDRERILAQLSHHVGRNVQIDESGGVVLTKDEIDALKTSVTPASWAPTSVFGIPIHVAEPSSEGEPAEWTDLAVRLSNDPTPAP